MARPISGKSAKTVRFEMRIEPEEADAYGCAAEKEGLSRAQWIRQTLNMAAKSFLGNKQVDSKGHET